MKSERDIAELIFDKFRSTNCKTGEIVMMRTIRFGVIDKLNPKEREIASTVLNGLIYTGFITYQDGSDGVECLRLTEKGYDYIYDQNKIGIMTQKPWVVPDTDKTDWDKAYNKLWRVIGSKDSAPYYLSGSQFYGFILKLDDDIQPSYTNYIEWRRKSDLSTSRVDYYKDLIDNLDEERRFQLYVNIQLAIEEMNDDDEDISDWQESLRLQAIVDGWDSPQNYNPIGGDSLVTGKRDSNQIPLQEDKDSPSPRVFISYSWDNKEHGEWVLDLATKLCDGGVDVILDKWEVSKLGMLIPNFMEKAISESQRVICVLTPNYKKKSDKQEGGVGYEYSIITAEIFSNGINTSKFIPLLRAGGNEEATPSALKGRNYFDMRENEDIEDLLRDIHGEPKHKKPTIGKKPIFQ